MIYKLSLADTQFDIFIETSMKNSETQDIKLLKIFKNILLKFNRKNKITNIVHKTKTRVTKMIRSEEHFRISHSFVKILKKFDVNYARQTWALLYVSNGNYYEFSAAVAHLL